MAPAKYGSLVAQALDLLRQHGPLTSAEIAERMGIRVAQVSPLLGRNVAIGKVLAERLPGPGRGLNRYTLNEEHVPAFRADTIPGMVLLALRAGDTEYSQLTERFGSTAHGALAILKAQGLVACKDAWGVTYRLTEAGRKACPTRRRQPIERRSHAQAA